MALKSHARDVLNKINCDTARNELFAHTCYMASYGPRDLIIIIAATWWMRRSVYKRPVLVPNWLMC